MKASISNFTSVNRAVLAIFYTLAGVLHIVWPAPFLTITPLWVPWPMTVIVLTGLCEIAGAVGLILPHFRKAAGMGLAFYAVAVFPANINHAMLDMSLAQPVLGLWYHVPRFMLQPILVWAALFAAGVINWPYTKPFPRP